MYWPSDQSTVPSSFQQVYAASAWYCPFVPPTAVRKAPPLTSPFSKDPHVIRLHAPTIFPLEALLKASAFDLERKVLL